MFNKRVLIIYVILTFSAAGLQSAPRIFGKAFVFAALLDGFPVYMAARFNYALGIAVYLTAAALLASANISEALFFTCTNGIIGLSLGIMKNRFKSIYPLPAISALIDIAILFVINYLLGISIFSHSALKAPVLHAIMLFPAVYLYCLLYLKLASSADNLLHKYIDLNIRT